MENAYVFKGVEKSNDGIGDYMDKDKDKDHSSSRNYNKPFDDNEKDEQLEQYRKKNTGPGKKLTSDAGLKISNDRWSLRAGKRGPTLFQDFHFFKKDRKSTRLTSSH